MKDYVVLINEKNEVLGTAEKLTTHNSQTPLHRGFSVFLFNENKELLLQQRSAKKKTWPLVWSNSCCGHPQLNESNIDAAKRQLAFELGITDATLYMILPGYRYRFKRDGIVENELCPVIAGFTTQKPKINADEVKETAWILWKDFILNTKKNPQHYSEWCIEEAKLLSKNKRFAYLLQNATVKLPSK